LLNDFTAENAHHAGCHVIPVAAKELNHACPNAAGAIWWKESITSQNPDSARKAAQCLPIECREASSDSGKRPLVIVSNHAPASAVLGSAKTFETLDHFRAAMQRSVAMVVASHRA
jgi:hypothetical protein